jgi:hypothetical protein
VLIRCEVVPTDAYMVGLILLIPLFNETAAVTSLLKDTYPATPFALAYT